MNTTLFYNQGYNDQLEKLGATMPGFVRALGAKTKTLLYGNKPSAPTMTPTAPTAQAPGRPQGLLSNLGAKAKTFYYGQKPSAPTQTVPTPQEHGYTKARDLFYNKKDVGFGKGMYGPADMGSRAMQAKFQKRLLEVPAGMSASGIPLPSGKELAERSRAALEQAKKIYADQGKPLPSMPRNMQRAYANINQKVRMKGIYDSPNQEAAAAKQPFFDDWGSVAPKNTQSGWVNQPGNNMPTMQPSMATAPTKLGSITLLAYEQTLDALGITGETKEAFVRALGRKVSDTWQKVKGRSPEFISKRRDILNQAKEKGEQDLLEKLKVKKGLKKAPTPPGTKAPEAPTASKTEGPVGVEAPKTPETPEEPSAFAGAKKWWQSRSPLAKAGLGIAAASPIAYGLYQMGGDEYTPQNINPVYPHQQ